MFGYNAGGGAYLPRQGSFMIQCDDTFIGLTGPGVVKSVLGEDVTRRRSRRPGRARPERRRATSPPPTSSARCARRSGCSRYLPDNNRSLAPFAPTSRPDRPLHDRGGHPVPPHLLLAGRHERAARHHAVPPADLRPRRVLRAAARARAQPDHGVRPHRRPRGRLRRQQLRGGVGPDRRRRGAQGHALHPLLQPLQHPDDLPRGHDRLPARHASRSRAASSSRAGACSTRSSTCACRASR